MPRPPYNPDRWWDTQPVVFKRSSNIGIDGPYIMTFEDLQEYIDRSPNSGTRKDEWHKMTDDERHRVYEYIMSNNPEMVAILQGFTIQDTSEDWEYYTITGPSFLKILQDGDAAKQRWANDAAYAATEAKNWEDTKKKGKELTDRADAQLAGLANNKIREAAQFFADKFGRDTMWRYLAIKLLLDGVAGVDAILERAKYEWDGTPFEGWGALFDKYKVEIDRVKLLMQNKASPSDLTGDDIWIYEWFIKTPVTTKPRIPDIPQSVVDTTPVLSIDRSENNAINPIIAPQEQYQLRDADIVRPPKRENNRLDNSQQGNTQIAQGHTSGANIMAS